MRRRQRRTQQGVRPLLQRFRELPQILRCLPEVAQDIVNVFAVGIQSTIQLVGDIVGGLQDVAQLDSIVELRHVLETANNVTDQLDRTLNANGENIDDILSNFRQASQNLRQFTETLKQRPYTLLRSAMPPAHEPGKVPKPD